MVIIKKSDGQISFLMIIFQKMIYLKRILSFTSDLEIYFEIINNYEMPSKTITQRIKIRLRPNEERLVWEDTQTNFRYTINMVYVYF